MRRSNLKFSVIGLGLASAAWSIPVTLADTTTKLDVGVVMQTRATHNWAETSSGKDFDVSRGSVGSADVVDFYGRRARLTVSAEREGWKGLITFAADNTDPAGKKSRAPELLYLWAEKSIKTGSFNHILHAGLDQANAQPGYRTSSSLLLLPTTRATATMPASPISAYGLRYQLNHSQFQFSADVQNNRAAVRVDSTETEGLFYATRVVASLLPGVAVPKMTESFAGEKGLALTLGADGTLDHSYVLKKGTTVYTASYATVGGDVVFHQDALTAIADYRHQIHFNPKVAGGNHYAYTLSVQAGYAIPVSAAGIVIEPALRGSIIDKDTHEGEAVVTAYSSGPEAEHGNSGYEGEAGLNIYFNGHKNKLQIGFQRWEAENSDANANILRVQHQFQF